jgi:hypothetical protein
MSDALLLLARGRGQPSLSADAAARQERRECAEPEHGADERAFDEGKRPPREAPDAQSTVKNAKPIVADVMRDLDDLGASAKTALNHLMGGALTSRGVCISG